MEDGDLMEFVEPLRVAEIMGARHGFFICRYDSMEVDQYLSPLPQQYQLKPGNLYFELPVNKLESRLPASDMAALAIQACAAKRQTDYGKKCNCKIMAFPSRNKVQLRGELEELNFGRGYSEKVSTEVYLQYLTPMSRKAWQSRLPTIPEGLAC
ncbi:uncharacterized protein LOC131047725 [Cryptomeria japonica]|uniref:uncharacterized protein LOC131047725 n=1 Tax=Cryptomeria japonica TaxID=3369 RepID=UPI0027DA47AF|nr:uncharacterized protein LOC131047725 [Cryptomeria japonica]